MTAVAKITSKGQTTIPQQIREALGVGPGDFISWDIAEDGAVRVRAVRPLDLEYLRALEGTVSEWAGVADEDAYRDL